MIANTNYVAAGSGGGGGADGGAIIESSINSSLRLAALPLPHCDDENSCAEGTHECSDTEAEHGFDDRVIQGEDANADVSPCAATRHRHSETATLNDTGSAGARGSASTEGFVTLNAGVPRRREQVETPSVGEDGPQTTSLPSAPTNRRLDEILREVVEDIQPMPMPSHEAQPRQQQQSHPGAHAVNGPGSSPVPVEGVQYSIFSRLSQHLANLRFNSSMFYTTSDDDMSLNLDQAESGNLVVANPIAGARSSEMLLQEAQQLSEQETAGETGNKKLPYSVICAGFIVVLLLLLFVVGIVLGITAQSKEDSTSFFDEESSLPTKVPLLTDSILALLPPSTQDKILLDNNSAQALAFQWMLQDPALLQYPPWRAKQRLVLAILFYATKGDHWYNNTNWLHYQTHECQWYTAHLTGDVGQVLAQGNYMTDKLRQQFQEPICDHNGKYHHLRLFVNRLSGQLPDELFLLTSLRSIHLSINYIQSTIPTRLGHLSNLQAFNIIGNPVSGTIPTQIGLVTNLFAIGMHSTNLQGTLPSELGLLPSLNDIYFDENEYLSGTIPTQVGRLTNAQKIFFQKTNLRGPLPPLGRLSRLVKLHIFDANLDGSIPTQIGQLSLLDDLALFHNNLTGSIPTEIGSMVALSNLDLSHNNLQGEIPKEIVLLKNGSLSRLDVSGNPLLSGTIPPELCRGVILLADCTELLCGCDCSCSVAATP